MKAWAVDNGKVIADVLTGVRFFVGLLIVLCALFAEPGLLPLVVCLTLIGWTTDVLEDRKSVV